MDRIQKIKDLRVIQNTGVLKILDDLKDKEKKDLGDKIQLTVIFIFRTKIK
jgi:hypothetical protein